MISDLLKTKLGDWVEVVDNKNVFTIDNFPYETGVTGPITKKHCAKCIAINKCWFKNEKLKKPEPLEILTTNIKSQGLYHPHCHCKANYIIAPSEDEINLIIPNGKTGWLFKDKIEWVHIWGYINESEFLKELYRAVKEAYANGNYKLRNHNKYGFQVDLYIIINGANEKKGKTYNLKSGFTIFSEGKLKCNTLIGGRWDNEIIR